MDKNDIDRFVLLINETIEYRRGKHLSQFTWGQKPELIPYQEHVIWFFDIIFEHLLSIQALSKGDRFPRYAQRLLILPRNYSFFLFGARGVGKSTLIRHSFDKANAF